jgi:hypothetical protein
MIFGSLALDMSSTKRRTTTSAYVALYTSLGFENGYKSLGDNGSASTLFNYYLSNDAKEFKGLETIDPLKSAQFIYNIDGGYLAISMTPAVFDKLPKWFKDYCNGVQCKLPLTIITSMTKSNNPVVVEVKITGTDKINHQFKINFTNVDGTWAPGTLQYSSLKITYNYDDAISKKSKEITDLVKLAKEFIVQIYEGLGRLSRDQGNKEEILEDLVTPKKNLAEAKKNHEEITKNLQMIQQQIAANELEIKKQSDKKAVCLQELQNKISEIEVEETLNKNKQSALDLQIQDNKTMKDHAEKLLFYWLEAAYYYRVFGERLLKSDKDVPAALLPANISVFTTKIKNAFYPQIVKFAEEIKK